MTYHIDIQNNLTEHISITNDMIIKWAELALKAEISSAELTILITSATEIQHLNNSYRSQNKATNVLAFPSEIPESIKLDIPLLGDIIVCPEVILKESTELNKSLESHFALIIIHGVLHLLGYDHIDDNDAKVMQDIEVKLLNTIGFPNPYLEDNNEI